MASPIQDRHFILENKFKAIYLIRYRHPTEK